MVVLITQKIITLSLIAHLQTATTCEHQRLSDHTAICMSFRQAANVILPTAESAAPTDTKHNLSRLGKTSDFYLVSLSLFGNLALLHQVYTSYSYCRTCLRYLNLFQEVSFTPVLTLLCLHCETEEIVGVHQCLIMHTFKP